MLEKLLTGPKTYYLWLLFLLAVIAGCGLVYLQQPHSDKYIPNRAHP